MSVIFDSNFLEYKKFQAFPWEVKLDKILHPEYTGEEQYPIDAEMVVQYPLIENRQNVFLIPFRTISTGEIMVGKILLPSYDERHNYTTRGKRQFFLKEAAIRNPQFSPEGVCIGLRPILPTSQYKKDVAAFGKIVTSETELDPRFEYVWFMYLLKAGESIDEKIHRNVAILKPLAESVFHLQENAKTPNIQTAWKFNNIEGLKNKFSINIMIYKKAMQVLKELVTKKEYENLYSEFGQDRLLHLMDNVFSNDIFRQTVEKRIEQGYIRNGHGDLKIKNIWFSDYYRRHKARTFKDCITFIDAIDFDKSYYIIDIFSEIAMLFVDLQIQLPFFDYMHFTQAYFQHFQTWKETYDMLLGYYQLEKNLVSTYIAILDDNDVKSAKKFIGFLQVYLFALEDSLKGSKSLYV